MWLCKHCLVVETPVTTEIYFKIPLRLVRTYARSGPSAAISIAREPNLLHGSIALHLLVFGFSPGGNIGTHQ